MYIRCFQEKMHNGGRHCFPPAEKPHHFAKCRLHQRFFSFWSNTLALVSNKSITRIPGFQQPYFLIYTGITIWAGRCLQLQPISSGSTCSQSDEPYSELLRKMPPLPVIYEGASASSKMPPFNSCRALFGASCSPCA